MDHSQYMEHGYCFIWDPPLVWLHVVSDVLTGLAYYSIALAMVYFAYRRKDIPFMNVYLLFALFILACGTTHFFAVYTIYVPAYWYEGVVKAVTAVVSVVAVFFFIPMIPKAIALPSLTKSLDENRALNAVLSRQLEELKVKDSAIATSINAIAFSDLNGRITSVNKAFLKLWGHESEEDVAGRAMTEFWQSEGDASGVFDAVRQTGEWAGELSARGRDGRVFVAEVKGSLVRDDAGRSVGMMLMCVDITKRKQAIEALTKSEEKYRNLYESMRDGFAIVSPDGKLREWNSRFSTMLGYRDEELTGLTYTDITPESWHAHERRIIEEQVFPRGYSDVYEKEYRRKDGTVFPVELRTFLLRDENGTNTGMWAIVRDVTERKRAERTLAENEARLRTLVQTIPDLVWLKDANGVYLFCNPVFERLFGAKESDIIGKTDYDFVDKDLADFFRDHDRKAVEAGRPSVNEEWLTFASDGYHGLFETVKTPMCEAEGKVVGVLGIARDITARKKAEEEKEKLELQLMQSQKMEAIGQLAGGVAHDFNNILATISGYGHLALMSIAEDDPQRPHIASMLEGVDRAAHLTKDLLLFSRKHAAERITVDLNMIVEHVKKFLLRVLGEDLEFKTCLHAAPLPVLADSNQLEQVLMNFATNARDAMPHGGVFSIMTTQVMIDRDFVAVHGYGKEGPYALLTVSDTGKGMDDETRQRIFEPFFTTKAIGKGTGLGLAVAYGIIKQHDGYVNVYSEPGAGTTFRIYLPLVPSEVTEKIPSRQDAPPPRGSETVLHAEDDATLRKLTHTILTQFGYNVIEAVDGEDAVRKYRENQDSIHLLLFDLVMPKMNGNEAYEEIRKISPGIKIVFTSGYAPDTIRGKSVFESNVPIVYKPVSPVELLKKVRRVLDGLER